MTICGALCTVSDVLVKNLPLKGNILGDFLVFERVGAYSVTEGIYLFLSRDLPVIYFYSQKKGIELVRDTIPMGDFLVFERVGAYSVTEGIYLFLSRDLPVIYFYSQKKGIELVRDTIPSSQLNRKRREEIENERIDGDFGGHSTGCRL